MSTHRLRLLCAVTLCLAVVCRNEARSDEPVVHYVSENGSNTPPYTNWAEAAWKIQDAIDAAGQLGSPLVLVSNGVYDTGGGTVPGGTLVNRVHLTNDVTVRSVNGSGATTILGHDYSGDAPVRCAYLRAGVLAGFTLTNGHAFVGEPSASRDECGGGAFLDSDGIISNCVVVGNVVDGLDNPWEAVMGGGLYATGDVRIVNCTIGRNAAEGGWINPDTGGVPCPGEIPGGDVLGGGAYLGAGAWMGNCLVTANEAVAAVGPCLDPGETRGGGVYCDGSVTLENCTIVTNDAPDSGAGLYADNGATVRNCIIMGNVGDEYDHTGTGNAFLYTCTNPTNGIPDGTGCIQADPKFVDAAAGNYRLAADSPCVDKGTNIWSGGATDLDGNRRVSRGTVDMGAYELQSPPNDDFADAYVLTGTSGTSTSSNQLASAEDGEDAHANAPGTPAKSVWWSWTAPEDGTLYVDTQGSDFDTVLALYTGAAVDALSCVASNDDKYGVQSGLNARVADGVAYSIAVDGWGGESGNVTLSWLLEGDPSITITNPASNIVVEYPTAFQTISGTHNGNVTGWLQWTNALTGGDGDLASGSPWTVADVLLGVGDNVITVYASNSVGVVRSDSVTITRTTEHLGDSPIHYVATNGASVWPYTNWSDAATTIQDAVDAAGAGDTVLVTNGVYDTGGRAATGRLTANRVCIEKAMSLHSVNGADATTVVGAPDPGGGNGLGSNAVRCMYLVDGVDLRGFTLTKGHSGLKQNEWWEAYSAGGGVFLDGGGLLRECVLTNNASGSGTVCCHFGGEVYDCLVTGNRVYGDEGAGFGAGAYLHDGGLLLKCVLEGNWGPDEGGALTCYSNGVAESCVLQRNIGGAASLSYGGEMHNCVVVDNTSERWGGTVVLGEGGLLNNCTVIRNRADFGGGVYCYHGGTVRNCLIYYNSADDGDNWYLDGSGSFFDHCCTTPDPGGIGNLTNPPSLVGVRDPHIVLESICVDAGTNGYAVGTDIDGEVRTSGPRVDIGCDEYVAGGVTGSLVVAILAELTNAVPAWPLAFQSDTRGKATHFGWDFGDGHTASNETVPSHAWAAPGVYDVVLSAFNEDYPGGVGATVVVHVASWTTNFVATNGNHLTPFTSWEDAATNIQDAINVCPAGGTVLVGDGDYACGSYTAPGQSLPSRVGIHRPVTVRSVNGAMHARILGQGPVGTNAVRGAYLVKDARLHGFEIRSGCTRTNNTDEFDTCGGGALLYHGGVVAECTFVSNAAAWGGGAAHLWWSGTVDACTFLSNAAYYAWGGGVYMRGDGGFVTRSTFAGNDASTGGAIFMGGGQVSDSSFLGNTASDGGAVHCWEGGAVHRCDFEGNCAERNGGALHLRDGGVVESSLIQSNSASGDGGGVYFYGGGRLVNSTVTGNTGNRAGGVYCWRGGTNVNSVIYGNTAYVYGQNWQAEYDGAWFEHCCISPTNNIPGGEGCVTGDPAFVNGPVGDYRLSANSPCLDAGGNAYVLGLVDLDGNPRIRSIRVDMGAYEAPVPGNDAFAAAFVLTGAAGSATGNSEYAGAELDEPSHYSPDSGTPSNSVWWTWTAPDDGTLAVDTLGSDFDTVLAIYVGDSVGLLTEVDSDDDYPGYGTRSRVDIRVLGGVAYHIAVDGYQGQNGDVQLNWQFVGDPRVTITDPASNIVVDLGTETYVVQGTNNPYVTGWMSWSNALNGDAQTFAAASPWSTAAIDIDFGENIVTVQGSNSVGMVTSDTVRITQIVEHLGPSPVHYVATNGAAVWPYTNWAEAATSIQDAVDAAASNDTVLVSNGVYNTDGRLTPGAISGLWSRVVIDRAVTVESVNGPSQTFVVGASHFGTNGPNAVRCAYLSGGGVISGFTLTNGHTRVDTDSSSPKDDHGGGVLVYWDGTMSNCVILGNSAHRGGGGALLGGGVLAHCTVAGNSADEDGGGIVLAWGDMDGAVLRNCRIAGNSAGRGGGGAIIYDVGTLENCTLVSNSAGEKAGGLHCYCYDTISAGALLRNTVIYFNVAPQGSNYWNQGTMPMLYQHCCTAPLSGLPPGNVNCTEDDPEFLDAAGGDYHLKSYSPCVDAGTNFWGPGATDLDGNPRKAGFEVDMGCYEYQQPVVTIANPPTDISVPYEVTEYTVRGTLSGQADGVMGWSVVSSIFAEDSFVPTNPWEAVVGPLEVGTNTVTVWATNTAEGAASDTVTIMRTMEHGGMSPLHYVATNGWHIWPYTNWLEAATNIQEAVDAAASNDTVRVNHGVYDAGGRLTPAASSLWSRVVIDRAVLVESVHGPSSTFIVGASDHGTNGPAAVRCVYLTAGVTLKGFTLTGGHTRALSLANGAYDEFGGGAILHHGGMVTNCDILLNSASWGGAGALCNQGGILSGCNISTNAAGWDGGGVYTYRSGAVISCTVQGNLTEIQNGGGVLCDRGGTVSNCLVVGNTAGSGGGGVETFIDGVVSHCTVTGNSAWYGGGICCWGGGRALNCVVMGNSVNVSGGGIECWESTAVNCLVSGNSAGQYGGGIDCTTGTVVNCTIVDNSAGQQGGGVFAWGATNRNCVIMSNSAADGVNWSNYPSATSPFEYCNTYPTNGLPVGSVECFESDPMFLDAGTGNYRLRYGSPCIDSGTNQSGMVTNDLDGEPRPVDGDLVGAAEFDIGCYEYDPWNTDTDGDGLNDGDEVAGTHTSPTNTNTDGDAHDDYEEMIADTDGADSNDYFRIDAISNLPPMRIYFLSSSNRYYRLHSVSNLTTGAWAPVAGQEKTGSGGPGPDSLEDPAAPADGRNYRVTVELP